MIALDKIGYKSLENAPQIWPQFDPNPDKPVNIALDSWNFLE